MINRNLKIWIRLFVLMSLGAMACTTLNRVNQTRETAQAVVTEVKGLATQGSSLVNTAQAFATQNPSLVETARSFTTTQGPSMLATAQAFATQHPEAAATAQALITQLPGILATGMDSTVIAGSTSPANPTIPIVPENQRSDYREAKNFVNYNSSLSIQELTDFYKSEMPVYDWLLDPSKSLEQEASSILVFTKGTQRADVIIIPFQNNLNNITITVTP
jgi:hypothetical protein